MTSVDADLWGGRRLEAGRRSESIIYNEKQNIPHCRQGRPNSIIDPRQSSVLGHYLHSHSQE
jgi:hypothetical protein